MELKKDLSKDQAQALQLKVKTMLLYGLESWKTTHEIVRKLRVFTHKCLCILLSIRWPQKITNFEVRNICKQEDIMVSFTRRKWTWIGHVLRRDPNSVSREGLFWTPEGKESEVDPKQLGGGQQRKS